MSALVCSESSTRTFSLLQPERRLLVGARVWGESNTTGVSSSLGQRSQAGGPSPHTHIRGVRERAALVRAWLRGSLKKKPDVGASTMTSSPRNRRY